MKEIITWFWAWEKSLWKEDIGTNRYFATLSILFAALVGACVGGGNTLYDWFGWQLQSSVLGSSALLWYIWCLNLAESILSVGRIRVMLLRSLSVTVCFAAAYGIGYIGSIVMLVLVALWVGLMVLGGFSSALAGPSKGGREYELEDGTRVKKSGSGLFGESYYKGNDGHRYRTDDGGGSFRRDG